MSDSKPPKNLVHTVLPNIDIKNVSVFINHFHQESDNLNVIQQVTPPKHLNASHKKNHPSYKYPKIDWVKLNIDEPLKQALQQRIEEIHKNLEVENPLSVVLLCGSTLEGLLQKVAHEHLERFHQAEFAPKNKSGNVKNIKKWALKELIDVAYEVGLIKLDTKKLSYTLWDFRNFIHIQQQVSHNFKPIKRTAKTMWDVLQSVIEDLNQSAQ